MIDGYDWVGGREAMLRFGPDDGPLVLVAPALFEEANRTRALTVAILRLLAERGIASTLPDLPGQAESPVPTSEATLTDWRDAFAAGASGRRVDAIVSIRGGALVDTLVPVAARWHLSPVAGADVLKDLWRMRKAVTAAEETISGALVAFGGNLLSPRLLRDLEPAAPLPARVVRLRTDPRAADLKIAGTPPWRSAEPANDAILAQTLADDIADWMRTCVG